MQNIEGLKFFNLLFFIYQTLREGTQDYINSNPVFPSYGKYVQAHIY